MEGHVMRTVFRVHAQKEETVSVFSSPIPKGTLEKRICRETFMVLTVLHGGSGKHGISLSVCH